MITSITANDLYQRQITLMGKEAFEKIRTSKVLVIGAGGLGCPALQYLVSSGVGEIGIVDFDFVSASNLQRQILFNVSDIGRKKVDVAKEKLEALAPFCEIKIYPQRLTGLNAESIISSYDVILDCTDNFTTKFLIHDFCFKTNKVLIHASVYQYEGQLHLFDFRMGQGPCLRCLWPEEPQEGCTGTCEQVGVIGPLLGVLGSLQVMETIKVITNQDHIKNGEVLFVDLMGHSLETRRFKSLVDCSCCIKKEILSKVSLEIDLPADLNNFFILDVRSDTEHKDCQIVSSLKSNYTVLHVPMENLPNFLPIQGQKYLIACASGLRSLTASKILIHMGAEAYSLSGGFKQISHLV
jgi:adenylyltransferase/sulfurtransferase